MSIFDLFIRRKKKINAPWSKYYTKEDLEYSIPNKSIYDQIHRSYKKYPNNIAIEYLGKKITYKSLINKIDIASKGFYDYGIRKGDIVTILLPNMPEALIALYALNKIGAIANMTHPLSAEEEIKETLTSTKSKFLIMYDAKYDQVKNFIFNLGLKKVIFVAPADSLNIFKRIAFNISQMNKFEHRPTNKLFISWNRFYFNSRFF